MTIPSHPHMLLELEPAVEAAERILRHPRFNAQRVSENEVVTLASIARQYRQLGILAARHLTGRDPDPAQLIEHLRASGFLPPDTDPIREEPNHG